MTVFNQRGLLSLCFFQDYWFGSQLAQQRHCVGDTQRQAAGMPRSRVSILGGFHLWVTVGPIVTSSILISGWNWDIQSHLQLWICCPLFSPGGLEIVSLSESLGTSEAKELSGTCWFIWDLAGIWLLFICHYMSVALIENRRMQSQSTHSGQGHWTSFP